MSRAAGGLLAVSVLLTLGGCSSHRAYQVNHEAVVQSTMQAIVLETNIPADRIARRDLTDAKGGNITKLEAPYTEYSRVHARVMTKGSGNTEPQLDVRVTTHKVMHTRHKDWEQRILERVQRSMTGK